MKIFKKKEEKEGRAMNRVMVWESEDLKWWGMREFHGEGRESYECA